MIPELDCIDIQLTRPFQPLRRVAIETINNEKAPKSPYLDVLRTGFDISVEHQNVTLYRKNVDP